MQFKSFIQYQFAVDKDMVVNFAVVRVMVMSLGMGDVVRERLPALWRRIEDAHYTYLETDDSPDKLARKRKLEEYIIEYLSLVPHECKFGLSETGKVFQRTINELPEFSAYRAGLGWAALARYAGNLLAQPWRKEYKVIRLYCGYYKHEVEANMVGAESLLHCMGYKSIGSGRMALDSPICPDMVAAVSRDALIAQCECQIMSQVWESVWGSGARISWSDVARERGAHAGDAAGAAHNLVTRGDPVLGYCNGSEIYSNVPVPVAESRNRYHTNMQPCNHLCPEEMPLEDPITPMIHPSYMVPTPNVLPPQMVYPHMHPDIPVTVTNPVPIMPYGVPYYYPVHAPYMIPTPVYAPIKHATNVPINGYPPIPQYRYPAVPTGQLIELDSPYENGSKDDRRRSRQESSRRNSTSKSNFSDVTLPSLPRSDTQPALSKAKEDGMAPSSSQQNYDLKAQLVVSLDEPDSVRRSPPKHLQNGDRPLSRTSHLQEKERADTGDSQAKRDRWECGTCTYLNRVNVAACEMCGKSKRGPEIQPLTSGGRECPACTLVNKRDAKTCDACGTSLEHCPTYI
ncbi:protein tamozhennic isoform X3 [Plodia interpunctella]|uniref:protein tamozhennic isoform X3 n=1 Tax=Plodia interpunctella TaxID=58824 RepID=UPI00236750DD|nr:protein tamozhennic isoform X3 [Plodia interpunctella]